MGTPGVPWDVPKDAIVDSLKKNGGRLTSASEALNCCVHTLDKYIRKDPELIELLKDLRRGAGYKRVAASEDKLMQLLDHKDEKIAMNSAFFILNTDDMAKECGWGNNKDKINHEDKAKDLNEHFARPLQQQRSEWPSSQQEAHNGSQPDSKPQ